MTNSTHLKEVSGWGYNYAHYVGRASLIRLVKPELVNVLNDARLI